MRKGGLIAGVTAYLGLVCAWLGSYWISGDRYAVISLANMLAIYLFTPLPLAALAAYILRNKAIIAGVVLVAISFIGLWGYNWFPNFVGVGDGPALTVMTYNVLGVHDQAGAVVDNIRQEGADVVMLQELNPVVANALEQELGEEYPFRVFDARPGVNGMGVMSRYPIESEAVLVGFGGVGEPQILRLEWNQTEIQLVNFHLRPTNVIYPAVVAEDNRVRERQAQRLARLVADERAAILAGDANTSPVNEAYKILAGVLTDAWRTGGFGLGHTFPGSDIPGSSRPRLAGIAVPRWLVRIDYVFTSEHWQVDQAWVADFDGYSDHRAVVARLVWEEE